MKFFDPNTEDKSLHQMYEEQKTKSGYNTTRNNIIYILSQDTTTHEEA